MEVSDRGDTRTFQWRSTGAWYVVNPIIGESVKSLVLQASYYDGMVQILDLSGEVICEIEVQAHEHRDVRERLHTALLASSLPSFACAHVILPDGNRLDEVLLQDPDATT